ncbi:MAG: 4-hydroxy-tetrahydrodipicolinate reductase [Actinomycetota bacterium]
MTPIKVGVIGAAGRMGSEVCRAVDGDDDLKLVARVVRGDSLDVLTQAGTEVVVEFTTPKSVGDHVKWCIDHDIHVVVGATGLTAGDLSEIETSLAGSKANVFLAPNFAVGAVLMMAFAARAASHFDTAEIVERHHERKLDAPSGTALRTARLMNKARGRPWSSAPAAAAPERGGDVDGVRIHSLRVPGSVAHQEVILGADGETLTIRHDSLDRSSFMPGVLLAIKNVESLSGLTVGLERLLDL